MRLYLGVTGGKDLRGFWKMTPAELTAWAEARVDVGNAGSDGFEDMAPGEEIED